MTAGFYKRDTSGELLYAPNQVLNRAYTLDAKNAKDLTRAVDGWKWYATAEEAIAATGATRPEASLTLEQLKAENVSLKSRVATLEAAAATPTRAQ